MALCVLSLIFKALLADRYSFLHFVDEKMEERLCCLPSCTELLNGNTEILRCMVFLVIQYSVEHGDHNLDASLTAIFGCLSSTLRGQTS